MKKTQNVDGNPKGIAFFRSLKNMIQNMAVYMYNNNPQKSMKVFFRDSDRKFATFEIRWSVYVCVFQTNNSRAFGAFENFLAIFILIYTRRMAGFIKQSAQKNSAIEIIPVHDQKECIL